MNTQWKSNQNSICNRGNTLPSYVCVNLKTNEIDENRQLHFESASTDTFVQFNCSQLFIQIVVLNSDCWNMSYKTK